MQLYWGISLSGKNRISFYLGQDMLEIIPKATRMTTLVEIWDTVFNFVADTFLSGVCAL